MLDIIISISIAILISMLIAKWHNNIFSVQTNSINRLKAVNKATCAIEKAIIKLRQDSNSTTISDFNKSILNWSYKEDIFDISINNISSKHKNFMENNLPIYMVTVSWQENLLNYSVNITTALG